MSESKLKTIGKSGEAVACKYLKDKKYKILCTNYNTRVGEVDIICENDSFVVFVEVKTRKKGSLISGAFSVNKTKQLHIIKTASIFLSKHKTVKQPRFDVIEVEYEDCEKKPYVVNHIISAFIQGGSYAAF